MSSPVTADSLVARPGNEWLQAMDVIADEDGYLEPLGPDHLVFFAETGTTLFVTFERAELIESAPDNMPAGWALAKANGWSFLCVIARGETFWRAPEVWGYFDRLVDDAFFDDFDNVLFYGAGPAGYAAASYVVTAPGAKALLISPRATLAPEIAGWDRRHPAARRLDFTSRYGYAPDMTEGASQVYLIHDPVAPIDNAHAALFRRSWTSMLLARWAGERPEHVMDSGGFLNPVITAAMEGSLTPARFAQLWRGRRGSSTWFRTIIGAISPEGSEKRQITALREAVKTHSLPRFERRLATLLEGQAAAAGTPDEA